MTPSIQPESSEDTIRALAAVKSLLDTYTYICTRKKLHNFDSRVMSDLSANIIHASGHPSKPATSTTPGIPASPNPTATFELTIDQYYANLNGIMHGGAMSLLFDMATLCAVAPIQREGYWDFMAGITRTLSISCLRPVVKGTKVRVHCWVMQHGRTMAMLRGNIESLDGKIVYATCEHHKVHLPSLAEHLELREEMRSEILAKAEESGVGNDGVRSKL